MGYDLHITRKEFWADSGEPKITKSEWETYISSDNQITQDKYSGENDYICQHDDGEFPLWYDDELGNIYTKNPTQNQIKKMVIIAKQLSAQVRGDDDELYDSNGEIIPEESVIPPKPWWKFW